MAGLPVEQREQVEDWLMADRLPLREVQRKLKEEFGVMVCHDTVARYERRLRQLSVVEDLKETMVSAQGLPGDFSKDSELLQAAALLLMRQQAYELLCRCDGDVRVLEQVGRLLVRAGEMEASVLRARTAEFKAQEHAMAKAWAEAEELRPIWNNEAADKDEKLREALLKVMGKLDPASQTWYERDQASKEARRCPHCEQVRPKDWMERKIHEAKMRAIYAVMGGRPMQKEEGGPMQNPDTACTGHGAGGNPKSECRNSTTDTASKAPTSDVRGSSARPESGFAGAAPAQGAQNPKHEGDPMQKEEGKMKNPDTACTGPGEF